MAEATLNKKLAEWAGITQEQLIDWVKYPENGKISVVGIPKEIYPNFTQSLDACFKWLVPKLDKGCDIYVSRHWDREGFSCAISNINKPEFRGIFAKADTPALALCLAIEKLIDEKDSTSS